MGLNPSINSLKLYTMHRSIQCHGLLNLHLSLQETNDADDLVLSAGLVLVNRDLQRLAVVGPHTKTQNASRSLVLAHCPQSLKELSFAYIGLSAEDTTQLRYLGRTLKSLELTHCPMA